MAAKLSVRSLRNPLRDLPPEVAVLSAVAFAVALGFGILAPAIPLFAKQFNVSNLQASAVISVFALMRFASSPISGRLVDRVGERLVMATGIGIVGVSSLLAGFSGSFAQLLVLRGVGGIGSSMFSISATALLLRVAAPDQRGRAAGAFQAGFLFGGITGPAFGSAVIGWSLRAPFFVYAATLLVAGSVASVYLARAALREREAVAGTDHPPTPFKQALTNAAYRSALLNNFATGWALFGVRSSLIPLFVVEGLHLAPAWTGWGLFASSVTQALVLIPVGQRVDRLGRRPFLRGGALLVLLAGLVLTLTASSWLFLLAMGLYGAGAAMLSTSSAAVVGDVIGGRGGSAVAAYQMTSDGGAFVGPLATGRLSDVYSYRAAFVLTVGVSALAFASTLFMPETRNRPPATSTPAAPAAPATTD